ncbi:MAG: cob(I)yrinic acid a,c-diamide adenosyltransferase [Theionarchaea archaeon]|nr:cob(I)yrinic acid a,c-diamide adenosyltransferase [Theionarchaea archaeon]MBU7001367.1 cob(I)yrinic acid a,c-diamide adenosyltransferase [Theionarchaea archaeon]MBU7019428.1 cob(I)yrinic acid a,c-diamide adenosyltransferase [Theionarchaea archaeon]MBU7034848.1 cob(I)yrinic acid a,c-diamide adenosyltransferase [Theionarchaea archaeon]MBU7040400.1 cob(I)yrinic acid a,c-diamide adenosyltransferase [Theionarchaea archaeon]
MEKGMIHVYTGNGKGKTTAALGLAMRAAGHGLKVYMIQFMKGRINYGELETANQIPNFEIKQVGRPDFVSKENPDPEDIRLAQEGLEHARAIIYSGHYDMVILDEINVAMDFNLVPHDVVYALLKEKPETVEIVLTGRKCPPEVVKIADYVSEVLEIKHPYMNGAQARKGIEW